MITLPGQLYLLKPQRKLWRTSEENDGAYISELPANVMVLVLGHADSTAVHADNRFACVLASGLIGYILIGAGLELIR